MTASPHVARQTRNRPARAAFAALASAAALSASPRPALALPYTWDNTSGDATWSNTINWSPNSEPNINDIATFPVGFPNGDTNVVLANGERIESMVFNDSYTMSNGTLQMKAPGAITVAASEAVSIASQLVSFTNLTKLGPGTLTLQNTMNSFNGNVFVDEGTLNYQNDFVFGATSIPITISNGAVLNVPSFFTTFRPFTLGTGGGTISVEANQQLALASPLTANANALLANGPGRLVVAGGASARTGSTTVHFGTLNPGPGAIGSGPIVLSLGGQLEIGGFTMSNPLTLGAGTRLTAGGITTYSGTISVNPGLASPVVLATTADTDRLTIGNAADDLTGTWNIQTLGNGTIVLPHANNFSGGWALTGGTRLQVGNSAALGTGTSEVTVGGAGTALKLASNVTLSRAVRLNGGGGLGVVSGEAAATGAVTVGNGSTVVLDTGAGIFDTLTVGTAASGGGLTGGNSFSAINVTGVGSLALPGASDVLAKWTIGAGAFVRIAADNRLGNAANTVTLSGGVLSLNINSGAVATARSITNTGDGILQAGNASTWTFNGPLTSTGVLNWRGDGAGIIAGPQTYAPGSTLRLLGGAGILTLASNAGSPAARNLTINAEFSDVAFAGTQHLAALNVSNGNTASVNIGPDKVIVVNSVTTTGAKLDLRTHKLVVAGGGAAALGTWTAGAYTGVTGQLRAGRNGGAWNGNGIMTSQTRADSGLTTLAIALASDTPHAGGTFGGVSVAANDVLVMYTYGGDADLSGRLDSDDYFAIDSNFNLNGSVFGYAKGDFDYNGAIDSDDYFIIDSNFNNQILGTFPTSAGAAHAGTAAVPEPSMLGGAALAAAAFTRRTRRDRRTRPFSCRGR